MDCRDIELLEQPLAGGPVDPFSVDQPRRLIGVAPEDLLQALHVALWQSVGVLADRDVIDRVARVALPGFLVHAVNEEGLVNPVTRSFRIARGAELLWSPDAARPSRAAG